MPIRKEIIISKKGIKRDRSKLKELPSNLLKKKRK